MKTKQLIYFENDFKVTFETKEFVDKNVQLVIIFGDREVLENIDIYSKAKEQFPIANIVILSTSGHLSNDSMYIDHIVVNAIEFEKSEAKTIEFQTDVLTSNPNCLDEYLDFFENEKLQSIIVLSEGTFVNGTELIKIISNKVKRNIPVCGGLAGDMFRFEKTIVGLNQNPTSGNIVLIGFYGDDICFKFGIKGGWRDFGPEREVTHSVKNTLYKIGDYNALDLYKEYLGEYAHELPGASLYFPLSIKYTPDSEPLVRTVLSINEKEKSMTFAGDIPEGSLTKFMRSNSDDLLDACQVAVNDAVSDVNNSHFIFVVSCVGRRVVLGNRQDEELDIIKANLPQNSLITGFYSYGEIAPNINKTFSCDLYNQSILITTIYEK